LATAYNESRWGVYIFIRLGDKKEKNDSNENENKQTTLIILILLVIPTTLRIVMAGILARFKRQDNPHPHN
jgi:flagellar basal body-associated protein FliL